MMEAPLTTAQTRGFSSTGSWFDRLEPAAAAEMIAASADIALLLDAGGVVRDFVLGSDDILLDGCVGRSWADMVTDDSRDKVTHILADACQGKKAHWREINMLQANGQVPVRFLALPVGETRIVAIGRDLRGLSRLQQKVIELQRSMDRQYQRLRSAETRYRLLFQMSAEAVIIVDAGNGRVTDANGAAGVLLGMPSNRITGRLIEDIFTASSGPAIDAATTSARAVGRADPIRIKPVTDRPEVTAILSGFRQEGGTYLLIRLAPPDQQEPHETLRLGSSQTLEVLRGFPEAFVVIDADRRILEANDSFLTLAELASLDQARGQRLDRWLGRPGIDVDLVVANLKEHGSLRAFSTILRGEYGAQEEVEITAVAVNLGQHPSFSLMIRALREQRHTGPAAENSLTRSVGQLTELVGRVSLKDLVRETTDAVEQMCIQAALNLTGDNRASAAQILGLSRQGLYAKLRRYGIGNLDGEADEQAGAAGAMPEKY